MIDRLYASLEKGADFARLAKRFSDDPGGRAHGGRLWITLGQTVEPFNTTAFRLPTGSVSRPLKTHYGWHIVQPLTQPVPDGVLVRLRVVGVKATTDQYPIGRVLLTPAFDRVYGFDSRYFDSELIVRLRHGAADLPAFRKETADEASSLNSEHEAAAKIQRSIHHQAQALRLAAAVGALLTFVLLAQALARVASFATAQHPTLRALGHDPPATVRPGGGARSGDRGACCCARRLNRCRALFAHADRPRARARARSGIQLRLVRSRVGYGSGSRRGRAGRRLRRIASYATPIGRCPPGDGPAPTCARRRRVGAVAFPGNDCERCSSRPGARTRSNGDSGRRNCSRRRPRRRGCRSGADIYGEPSSLVLDAMVVRSELGLPEQLHRSLGRVHPGRPADQRFCARRFPGPRPAERPARRRRRDGQRQGKDRPRRHRGASARACRRDPARAKDTRRARPPDRRHGAGPSSTGRQDANRRPRRRAGSQLQRARAGRRTHVAGVPAARPARTPLQPRNAHCPRRRQAGDARPAGAAVRHARARAAEDRRRLRRGQRAARSSSPAYSSRSPQACSPMRS